MELSLRNIVRGITLLINTLPKEENASESMYITKVFKGGIEENVMASFIMGPRPQYPTRSQSPRCYWERHSHGERMAFPCLHTFHRRRATSPTHRRAQSSSGGVHPTSRSSGPCRWSPALWTHRLRRWPRYAVLLDEGTREILHFLGGILRHD